MNKQVQIAILVGAAIVLGGGGFVAGMTVGPGLTKADAAIASPAASAGARAGAGGVGAGFGGARVVGGAGQAAQVAGRVISVGEGSITIEARQPGSDQPRSVIVLVGGSARVVRTTETDIKLSDIKAGDQVVVIGQPDQATGAVSANAVVVGLGAFQQIFGGGQAAPSGSGAPRRASPSPTR